MTRRLYNIAVVTSLVLFVVVMGLWVYSGFYLTVISLGRLEGGDTVFFGQQSGAIGAGLVTHGQFPEIGLHIERMPHFKPLMRSDLDGVWLGLGYASTANGNTITIPHWLLALLTATLLVVLLIRRRHTNPDPDAVPCVRCGYDLRESRDACPECGERVS